MKRFVTESNPYLLLGWAASRLGYDRIWPAESIPRAVVDEDGKIHAVVIYNAFYDGACVLHIATENTKAWATRRTIQQLFEYPFLQLGLDRINLRICASNNKAQILALKLGFRFEGVQRQAFNGEDLVQLGMLKSECRFLPVQQNNDGHDALLRTKPHEAENGKTVSTIT